MDGDVGEPAVSHWSRGSVQIGRDPDTVAFALRAEVPPGELTVAVHGTAAGYAEGATTENVAAAIRSPPDFVPGQTICMYSCYAGSNGTAEALANELGSPVRAPTNAVNLDPGSSVPYPGRHLGDVPAMKELGRFREFSPSDDSVSPISSAIDPTTSEALRRLVAFYLVQGGVLRYTMQRDADVIDGERVFLTAGLRTDGVWYWRADLSHYVLKYGVTLPAEFIEHARNKQLVSARTIRGSPRGSRG